MGAVQRFWHVLTFSKIAAVILSEPVTFSQIVSRLNQACVTKLSCSRQDKRDNFEELLINEELHLH